MIPKDYWASCIFVASDTPFSLNASMVKAEFNLQMQQNSD